MQNLKLRQVGVRHVCSDGRNDLGELPEAHLRAYVASLPGSYTIDTRGTQPAARNGLSRAQFADAVKQRMIRLLASDPELKELEAHRLASSQIMKENPAMLSAYRADILEI